jgi:hypothetical protein
MADILPALGAQVHPLLSSMANAEIDRVVQIWETCRGRATDCTRSARARQTAPSSRIDLAVSAMVCSSDTNCKPNCSLALVLS